MTVYKLFVLVLAGATTCAAFGAASGAALGTFTPGYYRAVCYGGRNPDFDPIQVGIGLGATEGFGLGVVLSLMVLVGVAIRDYRRVEDYPSLPSKYAKPTPPTWTLHALWALAMAIALVVCCVIGAIAATSSFYRRSAEAQLQKIATVIQSNEFPNIHPESTSDGRVLIYGDVPNKEIHDSLRDKLAFAFGKEAADKMIQGVEVKR